MTVEGKEKMVGCQFCEMVSKMLSLPGVLGWALIWAGLWAGVIRGYNLGTPHQPKRLAKIPHRERQAANQSSNLFYFARNSKKLSTLSGMNELVSCQRVHSPVP